MPVTSHRQYTAELILFATTFIWSSTFIVIKWGLAEFSPLLFLTLRFTLAAALFLPLFPAARRGLSRSTVRQGSLLGLFLFIGFALQTVGLDYTTASKSAFLTGLMVIFTPLIQVLWRRNGPAISRANVAGIGLVVAGLWLLTNPWGGLNAGDVLTLLCAVSFAGFIVHLDRVTPAHDPAALTFAQIASTALYGWIAVVLLEQAPRFNLTWAGIGAIVYLAVAATIVTGYLMTRFQKDTTPVRAVVIYTIEPVWAALMAAALLGERLTMLAMLGGGLILAGLLVSELAPSRR
ncbi:MAG: DMT family transporter [Nitrospirota bacterium]